MVRLRILVTGKMYFRYGLCETATDAGDKRVTVQSTKHIYTNIRFRIHNPKSKTTNA
jgi:hypothetical protein